MVVANHKVNSIISGRNPDRILWASYLWCIEVGSENLGTSNPIVLFYGVVFGQRRQAQIHYLFHALDSKKVHDDGSTVTSCQLEGAK